MSKCGEKRKLDDINNERTNNTDNVISKKQKTESSLVITQPQPQRPSYEYNSLWIFANLQPELFKTIFGKVFTITILKKLSFVFYDGKDSMVSQEDYFPKILFNKLRTTKPLYVNLANKISKYRTAIVLDISLIQFNAMKQIDKMFEQGQYITFMKLLWESTMCERCSNSVSIHPYSDSHPFTISLCETCCKVLTRYSTMHMFKFNLRQNDGDVTKIEPYTWISHNVCERLFSKINDFNSLTLYTKGKIRIESNTKTKEHNIRYLLGDVIKQFGNPGKIEAYRTNLI